VSEYRNALRHAVDLPGGALAAPGATVELDDEAAAPLVEAGVLAPVEPEPKKKEAKT